MLNFLSRMPIPGAHPGQSELEETRCAPLAQWVRGTLNAKFRLGLFENPYARRETLNDVYGTQKAKEHSLKSKP